MANTPLFETHLVVCADDLVTDLQLALLQLTDMQNVAVVHLHIGHLELGLAVNGEDTSIVLLSTLLGVKVGLVK